MIPSMCARLVSSGHSNYNSNMAIHNNVKDQSISCSYSFVTTLSLEGDEESLSNLSISKMKRLRNITRNKFI